MASIAEDPRTAASASPASLAKCSERGSMATRRPQSHPDGRFGRATTP